MRKIAVVQRYAGAVDTAEAQKAIEKTIFRFCKQRETIGTHLGRPDASKTFSAEENDAPLTIEGLETVNQRQPALMAGRWVGQSGEGTRGNGGKGILSYRTIFSLPERISH